MYLEYTGQNIEYKIEFIRNMLVNESEKIDNIYKMRSDISHETALRLNPYVESAADEVELFEAEGISKYDIEKGQGEA